MQIWLVPVRIRGGAIISYMQEVEEQKSESKVLSSVTPNAQSAVADMYIYTYVYLYIYTHVSKFMCIYIYAYIHICVYMYIYIWQRLINP